MNMKNVIKRIGVIFIFGPIFIFCLMINIIIWLTVIFWGPFYYIITGKDLFVFIDDPFSWIFNLADWYMRRFGPDDI